MADRRSGSASYKRQDMAAFWCGMASLYWLMAARKLSIDNGPEFRWMQLFDETRPVHQRRGEPRTPIEAAMLCSSTMVRSCWLPAQGPVIVAAACALIDAGVRMCFEESSAYELARLAAADVGPVRTVSKVLPSVTGTRTYATAMSQVGGACTNACECPHRCRKSLWVKHLASV